MGTFAGLSGLVSALEAIKQLEIDDPWAAQAVFEIWYRALDDWDDYRGLDAFAECIGVILGHLTRRIDEPREPYSVTADRLMQHFHCGLDFMPDRGKRDLDADYS